VIQAVHFLLWSVAASTALAFGHETLAVVSIAMAAATAIYVILTRN